jgi:Putative Actinobacterial Holin-X, holin superfamily III
MSASPGQTSRGGLDGGAADAGGAGDAAGEGSASRSAAAGIATAITEVSERASLLVREEIELAKAEVAQKAGRIARGAVVALVAGVFFATALVFALVGCAWLLYYYLPGNQFTVFWGFFAMAAILVVLGMLAGLIAWRAVRRSAPPVPEMAIEEARKIRDAVGPASGGKTADAVPPLPSSSAAPVSPPAAPPSGAAPPQGAASPSAGRPTAPNASTEELTPSQSPPAGGGR